MARFDRLQVLESILDTGLLPMFDSEDVGIAERIVAACVAGGAKVVEFRNRGEQGFLTFAELLKRVRNSESDAILGAGSIVDAPTAALYLACGANFIVGPSLNAEVAKLCNRRKVPYSPGCGSVSEISNAEELGCEIVKVFPGKEVGGPSFVKAVLGPMPWVRIMPTGGVESTEASLKAWFAAGVACVGMGSNLVTKELLKAGDYAGIAAKVKDTLDLIRKIRGGK